MREEYAHFSNLKEGVHKRQKRPSAYALRNLRPAKYSSINYEKWREKINGDL